MHIISNWDAIIITETDVKVRDSTLYFDDIDNPINTPRDRKNMRVKEDSLYVESADNTHG